MLNRIQTPKVGIELTHTRCIRTSLGLPNKPDMQNFGSEASAALPLYLNTAQQRNQFRQRILQRQRICIRKQTSRATRMQKHDFLSLAETTLAYVVDHARECLAAINGIE